MTRALRDLAAHAAASLLALGPAVALAQPVPGHPPAPTHMVLDGSTLVYPSPSGNANSGLQPTFGTLSGTSCLVYKATTGSFFGGTFYLPGATFLQVIDSATAPGSGTTLMLGAQSVNSGNYGVLAAPVPVPPSGFISWSDFFPSVFVNGLVICATTNSNPLIMTPTTGTFIGAAKEL